MVTGRTPSDGTAVDVLPDWSEISAHLDKALALAPTDREAWLSGLAAHAPTLANRLRRLLVRLNEAEALGFLDQPARLRIGAPDPAVSGCEATTASHHAGQRVGPWRLQTSLGCGGMAEVWQAERQDGLYRRTVALKLPILHLGAGQVRAWAPERNTLAALNHPGITRLYDAGNDEFSGQPWLAMELVRGQALTAWCHAAPRSQEQRLRILRAIAEALQYAHSRLVVHRDLKPSNILVDDEGTPHLLDFGIAFQLGSTDSDSDTDTDRPMTALTPGFAAPEQWLGLDSGTAVDIYALGVVAYLVLADRHPFVDADTMSKLWRTQMPSDPQQVTAAPPLALRSGLNGDFDAVLTRALHPDPTQRYITSLALIEDLERAAQHRPVQARAPGAFYRWKCFLRRHSWRLAAGFTVSAMVATGGTVHWQQRQQARQSIEQASAVTRFLGTLFNPSGGISPSGIDADTPAREVLRIAVERMRSQLSNAPQQQYTLLAPALDWFDALGLEDEAEHASRDLLRLAAQQYGRDSAAYAIALTRRVRVLIRGSQEATALHLAQQAVALCERLCDPRGLASALGARAQVQQALEPWPFVRADADYQRAITLLRGAGGSEDLASRIEEQARLWSNTGREENALVLLAEARDIMTRVHGAQSWPTASILREMAGIERVLMRPDAARAHFDEAVNIMARSFGPNSPPTQSLRLMRAELLLPAADSAALDEDLTATADRFVRADETRPSRRDWALELRLATDVRRGHLAQAGAQCRLMDRAFLLQGDSALLIADNCARQAIAVAADPDVKRWLSALALVVRRDYADAPIVMKRLRQREGEWAQVRGDRATAIARYRDVLAMTERIDLRERALAWRSLAQLAPDAVDAQALAADLAFVESASAQGLLAEYRAQLLEAQAWLAAGQQDWGRALESLAPALADRVRHGGPQSAWHADALRWQAAWATGRAASVSGKRTDGALDVAWLAQLEVALGPAPASKP